MNTLEESQIGSLGNPAPAPSQAGVGTYVWRALLLAPVLLAIVWRAHHDPQTEAERQARLQIQACWHELDAASQTSQAPVAAQCLRLEKSYETRYAR